MSNIILDADSTTLVLNGHAFTSFSAGDIVTLTPVNALTSQTPASNQGVTINKSTIAGVHDLKINVQKYSDDDIFLNEVVNATNVEVLEGSLKEDFTRDGVEGQENWSLEGGSITTLPTNTKNDTDGNAMLEYTIRINNAKRAL